MFSKQFCENYQVDTVKKDITKKKKKVSII